MGADAVTNGSTVMTSDEGLIDVPGMWSRRVRLPSGVDAHYMTSGATGPSVVLIHGGLFGGSGLAGWRDIAPALGAAGFRVYCPDMIGFGGTFDHAEVYGQGLGAQTSFLRDFVDTLALDRFHIAGNSMGCRIAVDFMVNDPARILSFAGIAGSFGDVVPEELLAEADKSLVKKADVGNFDGSEAAMRRILEGIVLNSDRISDDLVAMRTRAANAQGEAYSRMMTQFFKDIRGTGCENSRARFRTRDRFEHLTIPSIYVFGQQDSLHSMDYAHVQEDHLPNVQVFYPPHCGHQSQTDDPDLHVALLTEFFSAGRVSASTAVAAGASTRRSVQAWIADPAS
jgi:2-hydroxy-6-oxonona-2,4-dienedioate hydrolase